MNTEAKDAKKVPRRRGYAPRTDWHPLFIETLEATGSILEASRTCKVDRVTAYRHRNSDAAFALQWKDATAKAVDALEVEARRRALDGVDEPVVYRGKIAGSWLTVDGKPAEETTPGARFVPVTIKRYDSNLLQFMLRGLKPKRYRENVKLEVKNTTFPPATMAALGQVTDAELHRLRELAVSRQQPGKN